MNLPDVEGSFPKPCAGVTLTSKWSRQHFFLSGGETRDATIASRMEISPRDPKQLENRLAPIRSEIQGSFEH